METSFLQWFIILRVHHSKLNWLTCSINCEHELRNDTLKFNNIFKSFGTYQTTKEHPALLSSVESSTRKDEKHNMIIIHNSQYFCHTFSKAVLKPNQVTLPSYSRTHQLTGLHEKSNWFTLNNHIKFALSTNSCCLNSSHSQTNVGSLVFDI